MINYLRTLNYFKKFINSNTVRLVPRLVVRGGFLLALLLLLFTLLEVLLPLDFIERPSRLRFKALNPSKFLLMLEILKSEITNKKQSILTLVKVTFLNYTYQDRVNALIKNSTLYSFIFLTLLIIEGILV